MTDQTPSSITVRHATDADYQAWDTFVDHHPDASPYMLTAWKRAVESAYKHRCYYLLAEKQGELVGILPLAHIKPPLLSGSLCSLPFCDLGGMLTTDEQARAPLLQEARRLSSKHSSGSLHLRQSGTPHAPTDSALENGRKVRMVLPLPNSAEELLASFKSKLRSQIKKAGKNGISYSQEHSSDALDQFYTVMQANMRMLGSPVHSKHWFAAIINHYGDKAQIGLVKYEDKVVGAAIILKSGNTVTVPWASTLAEYNRLSPNMGLYWGLLSHAADNNFNFFDFGRSSIGEGTYKFKKQWGATPVPLDWKDYDANGEITAIPSTNSKNRELIAATWAKLPEIITNILGPIFRRYISL